MKLNSGVEYRGVLSCLDGFLNVAMEQTEEYVAGVKRKIVLFFEKFKKKTINLFFFNNNRIPIR